MPDLTKKAQEAAKAKQLAEDRKKAQAEREKFQSPGEAMNKSYDKKYFAKRQEMMGNAQIKNKVKPGSQGSYPVGQERLDIAKEYRREATLDSLHSVNMSIRKKPTKK